MPSHVVFAMTDVVYDDDRVGTAQALWTHQLKDKTTIDAFTEAFAEQAQAIEDACNQLRSRLDIDTQEGVQLEKIGELVGQPRQGRQDEIYRLWLKARIRVNKSNGTSKDLYDVAYTILGTANTLYLQHIPVGVVLLVSDEFPVSDIVSVQRILQQAAPVAVPVYVQYAKGSYDRFRVTSGSIPIAASDNGYNNGRLVDWIGPDQTPNPYANIQHAFGRRLIDCWDCRKVVYNSDNEAIRLPGLNSELRPYIFGVGTSPTKSAVQRKSSIYGINLSSRKCFVTQNYTSMFSGTNPWTVAMHITTSSDSDSRVFEVSNFPYIEAGPSANYITVIITTSYVALTRAVAGSGVSFFGSAISTNTPTSLIVSYDGAGNATFWINGSKTTDTDTHANVPDLAYMNWGEYEATDDTTTWDGYKLAIFDRVFTDTEAQHLTDILDREFTDNAYY